MNLGPAGVIESLSDGLWRRSVLLHAKFCFCHLVVIAFSWQCDSKHPTNRSQKSSNYPCR